MRAYKLFLVGALLLQFNGVLGAAPAPLDAIAGRYPNVFGVLSGSGGRCLEIKFHARESNFENGKREDGAQITATSVIDPLGKNIAISVDPYKQADGSSFKTISGFDGMEWKTILIPIDAGGHEVKGIVTIDKQRNADYGDISEGYLTGEALLFSRFTIAKGEAILDYNKYINGWKIIADGSGGVIMSQSDDCSGQTLVLEEIPAGFPLIKRYEKVLGKCDSSQMKIIYEYRAPSFDLAIFGKKLFVPSGFVRRVYSGSKIINETYVQVDSVKIVEKNNSLFNFEIPAGWVVRDLISGFSYINGSDDVTDLR